MRIAYVTETYPPELNGVSLTVERTVVHLRTRGHAVLLVRPRQPGDASRDDSDWEHRAERAAERGVESSAEDADQSETASDRVHTDFKPEWRTAGMPIPMYADLRFGLVTPGMVRKRLAAWRADLVHVATPGLLGWAAARAAGELDLPVSSDFRTNFHQYSHYYGIGWLEPMVRAYLRHLHNRTQCTFVPTAQLKRQLEAAGFRNLRVLGRGVDTARFSPARRSAALRNEWQATAAPVLLYAGRLAAEKNVGLALRAFEALRTSLPEARMVVVGDGPMRSRLEAEFPAARFVGVQRGDDLAAHYASADLFLFPSLSDTFGNVVMEALASGLPVIAFRTAAAAVHVRHGASGLLSTPGDETSFISAPGALAGSSARLAAARVHARAAAVAASWDSVLEGFERQLESTLHAHQTATANLACPA